MSNPFCSLWRLFIALSCLQLTHALRNITVDNKDSSIQWFGNWSEAGVGFGNHLGGSYQSTQDRTAYAEFKFTGVAVYFVSARWPQAITTQITLDPALPNSRPLLLSLEDYETPTVDKDFNRAAILASATGLANTEHTVRVEMGSDESASYAIFDAFIYTILEESDIALAPNPSTNNSSSTPAFSPVPSNLITPLETASSSPTPIPTTATTNHDDSFEPSGSLSRAQLSILLICIFVFLFFGCCGILAWKYKLVRRDNVEGDEPETTFRRAERAEAGEAKPRIVSEDLTEKMKRALCEKDRDDTVSTYGDDLVFEGGGKRIPRDQVRDGAQ
ncbi:hypothetical protein CC1G_02746 [Coprinopsis cinerea okayama7|uniref:Uncharacterized protein n=1 Tax=Coprinopsis cinerea (strain Okayama-7 / 130 / ATCC MYA-4618 / FGSC 9003) TaxID=240176 RepID=A8MZY1_COPC7|nr:hypothetical protein CC1G_02746 [Coprinopsis cinerea okayama7\|eukprot:XP_001828165.1 hypothetical protein CC1G_02746 [Coprinopsis cinerea okayama7\